MNKILAFSIFVLISINISAQKDSASLKKYEMVSKFPFFNYCKNCSVKDRAGLLCGHGYRNIFLSYSFDTIKFAGIGFSKDIVSCYPDHGGQFFSVALFSNLKGKLINGIRLTYLRDHIAGLQFYYLKFGINTEFITNYQKSGWVIRPEIRLMDNMDYSYILSRLNLSYSYTIYSSKPELFHRVRHLFTLSLDIKRKGWIS